MAAAQEERVREAANIAANAKRHLFPAIAALGIAMLSVTYDGYGDDGNIEGASATWADGSPVADDDPVWDQEVAQQAVRAAAPARDRRARRRAALMDHLFEEDIFELVALPPAEPGNVSRLPELAFRADAWLPSEEATLRRLFEADESIEDIALALRRPLSGVRTRISDLGMRRRSTRPWTEFDDQHLMRRYGEDPTSVIALEIGRTTSAIYARAAMLGLTEGNPPPYTAWEDA
jgi:hypothetical protein